MKYEQIIIDGDNILEYYPRIFKTRVNANRRIMNTLTVYATDIFSKKHQ